MGREQQATLYALMLPKWKILVQENEQHLLDEASAFAEKALEYLQVEATSVANNAFLSALSKGPETSIRAARMAEEMMFETWDASGGERFILGDCGPVALFTDNKPRLALGAIDDEVEMTAVFLPVSPTRCIVGNRSNAPYGLNVPALNQISAALSHEFFVSDLANSESLTVLRQSIGSLVPIATEEEILRVIVDKDPAPEPPVRPADPLLA